MTHESVQDLFSRVAERLPHRVAVERGDERVTYGELEEATNRLASYLVSTGVGKGSVVGVLAHDTAEVITAILGVLKAGCVFVPLDPSIPERRLRAMVAEVSPVCFLSPPGLAGEAAKLAAESGARVVSLGRPGGESAPGAESYAGHDDATRPAVGWQPDDMCYVYFTSGSTGRPKGIAGRLKGIDHFVRWEIATCGVGEGTRVSQLISPSFDAFLRDAFTPLCAGGTVCAPESRDVIVDAAALARWLDEREINLVHCVPSLLRAVINQDLSPDSFPALRDVLLSGEPLLPADVKRWVELFGERIRLVNLYGPTETTMTKFFYFVRPTDAGRRSIPIGKPMEGARALVLDAKGAACPPGAIGEIHIRTPYRTLGYYGQPELTAEVFIPNPFGQNPDDLIYRTGDLGRVLEDGNFEFLGRKDQQVKIRGVRIELREIESALREHEAVADVAVVDFDDAGGNKYLCAYVVPGGEAGAVELREHLAASLPPAMIPSAFVFRDSLPRTISGKLDRKALPPPSAARAESGAGFAPARTPVEEVLCGIWASVVGVERVGVEDDFFSLGGHSLLATQLLARVRETLGVELPLRSLFEAPTVAGQARRVEDARREGKGLKTEPVVPTPRDGELPLSFAQQRLWFIDQLQPGSVFYNISTAVRLTGRLDVRALELTLTEITRRHEVLRTTFETADGRARQVIAPPRPFRLPLIDLSRLGAEQREAELAYLLREEPRRAFDLASDQLARATLVRLDEESHVALFTIHHIVSDGWSMGVLVREVAALYRAFAAGEPSPLPELPVQYVDFARWQRERLRGPALEALLSYWRGQLEGAPTTLNLPTARVRPEVQTFRGSALTQQLPLPLSESLKALSRREGATLFMTLLAAFNALLHLHTGQEDIVLGSPIAARDQVELENMIGFFANTLVLRTDLSGDPTFRELLARVREAALGAYAHQDLPFDKLVEELRPERNLSHNPLFQAAFTLDNDPGEALELPGLKLETVGTESETVQLDLVLHMAETARGLSGALHFSTDLFDEAACAKLLADFEALLHKVSAEPDLTLGQLKEALAEADRRRWEDRGREVGEINLRKLRAVRRKAVNAAQVEIGAAQTEREVASYE
jgi:amino acid adenylation domain-containing protein